MRNAGVPLIIGAIVGLMFFAFASFVFAHDHNRPELNAWFHDLHSRGKAWCCDGSDAVHLRDADWETKAGHYRVKIPKDGPSYQRALKGEDVDTMWADVPDDAVIDDPNRDGATMVWPTYGYQGASVRCFMPGSMT